MEQRAFESGRSAHGGVGSRPWTQGVIDELLSRTAGLLGEGARRPIVDAQDRLAAERFNLVVLGEFKRGKSSLINALLGRDVLPTGVVPLTSIVTALGGGGRDRLIVGFDDGREEEHPLSDLGDYVTEAGNPGNRRGVKAARVELDHELLRGGLEVVDTPGVGSIHSHNTLAARRFLPHVDAALCVLDAGQPLSEGERSLFAEAAQRVPRLLMVVNKVDQLSAGDRDAALRFIAGGVGDLFGDGSGELFAVSAREGDGIAPLLERLRRLARQERDDLLLKSVAGVARLTASQGAQAARFEAAAIRMPLDELDARVAAFEERIAELRAACAEAGDLLDRGVARALATLVDEPLIEYARREEGRLRVALDGHVEALGRRPPRELSGELERRITDAVRAEFERLVPAFETAIADELSSLEGRYAGRVERILIEVQEAAHDAVGVRAADVMPATGLRSPSRFSFKLVDVEHALDILVGFGRTAAPGAFGRRLVVRDAHQRLIDLTDRHAGRLRSELSARVSAAADDYRRELSASVRGAIDAIGASIDRAAEDRRRGESHARIRIERLGQVERRCEELAGDLDLALGDSNGGRPRSPDIVARVGPAGSFDTGDEARPRSRGHALMASTAVPREERRSGGEGDDDAGRHPRFRDGWPSN